MTSCGWVEGGRPARTCSMTSRFVSVPMLAPTITFAVGGWSFATSCGEAMKVEVAPSMVCLLLFAVGGSSPAATVAVKSPNEAIQCTVAVEGGRLPYRAVFLGRPVIETSPLGVALAAVDLGQVPTVGKAAPGKS